jgi:hypothetical protein
VAAAGLWLYEENRVEGALNVVANTSPAAPAPVPGRGAQAFAAESAAPAVPVPAPAAPEPVRPVPAASDVPAPAEQPAAGSNPVAGAGDKADKADKVNEAGTKSPERKRTATKARRTGAREAAPVATAKAAPSPRQRRDETLLQCRVHGYDARQCIQRGCSMTRYGLVCRG